MFHCSETFISKANTILVPASGNKLTNKILFLFYSVGRRIKIFLRLKANGKIVVLVTSVASFAKVLYVNKS